MLRIDDVHAGYGQIRVLQGITLDVPTRSRLGLFGPNGHGKTTLLRTISGLVRPVSGTVAAGEKDLGNLDTRAIVELGIIHVPQGSPLFPEMTVEENLFVGSYSRRARPYRKEGLERVYDLFPPIAERRRQAARTLSGGERQMLAIGVGLMGSPEVLMLDEPTLGLAPRMRETLATAIREIAMGGVTTLVVDQDVEFLLEMTERLALLEQGRIVLNMSRDDLNYEQVLEMYFGRPR